MNRSTLFALPLLALALAGCSSTGTPRTVQAPVQAQPVAVQPLVPTSAQTVQTARLTTSIANGFVDPAALSLMSAKDSTEANSAQFYALQFGRPGAPRQWAGDGGTTGSVAVGPYVRVNNLDCRDFTHTVKVNGTDYVRKGTACREQNGNWNVVQGAA
ncbi:RT0821/Lpp0805 family surface protein [Devosia sp. YIM 151766]|uniref:RT0821/Lpp0805 family surface protein n=1 Tax=Devosia sp. YIM 151766 TaxID=3017325 RepID=UPI00255C6B97|nr:RT0821/Lpp0805 family surface protein [Devosia sp. YIM 151766]WIY53683.1 RT0821/Lpp0805 family surface protein [Devosia sp. YIM 151766]